jgi:glutamate/tyrosine decarboxylase-like PLP-dependent enzyme
MLEKIKQLERISRKLEPSCDERAYLTDKVTEYANAFIENIPDAPAFRPTTDNGRGLYTAPISEEGLDLEGVLELLQRYVDQPALNPTSARNFGYVPGGGLFHAALGDYLAAISNRYAGLFFVAPGAVRMENMLLRWMADIVGYPATAAGNLTSGGSIGGLSAVVAARESHHIQPEDIKKSVVYLTEHVHHSVGKALRIAGLGSCLKRLIAVDRNYRMDSAALADAIAKDRKSGLQPWLIVASAGTTNTGSVDPLAAIGDIANRHQLWLHIDGAYGAFYILCESGQAILQGMEKSDSIVMDPHKTLFLPYGSGAVLVKDGRQLYESHHQGAAYMQDALEAIEELSPADLSPELTKHFKGLRLWLPLKLLGVAPFRAALEEKILLARHFHHQIQEVEGFEVGPYPDLAIATYRYLPKRGDANAFNRRLIRDLQNDGRVFLSSTLLNGKFVLRLAVGVYRSHLDDIEEMLERVTEKARYLERNG